MAHGRTAGYLHARLVRHGTALGSVVRPRRRPPATRRRVGRLRGRARRVCRCGFARGGIRVARAGGCGGRRGAASGQRGDRRRGGPPAARTALRGRIGSDAGRPARGSCGERAGLRRHAAHGERPGDDARADRNSACRRRGGPRGLGQVAQVRRAGERIRHQDSPDPRAELSQVPQPGVRPQGPGFLRLRGRAPNGGGRHRRVHPHAYEDLAPSISSASASSRSASGSSSATPRCRSGSRAR